MILRAGRWLWLLVFFFPLSFVAGRFCWFGPTDDAYHGLVALHEVLPQVLLVAALASMARVAYRLAQIRRQLGALAAVSTAPPPPVRNAFAIEARRMGVAQPTVLYVDAAAPLCFTGFRWRRMEIFISSAFAADLSESELRLVAHHEIVHLRDRHPAWNVFWHVLFSALLLPAFTGLERMLRHRRELLANVSAARIDSVAYRALLVRRARDRQSLCFEGSPKRERSLGRSSVLAPVAVLGLFVALGIAHADFMRDLPYLVRHHC